MADGARGEVAGVHVTSLISSPSHARPQQNWARFDSATGLTTWELCLPRADCMPPAFKRLWAELPPELYGEE